METHAQTSWEKKNEINWSSSKCANWKLSWNVFFFFFRRPALTLKSRTPLVSELIINLDFVVKTTRKLNQQQQKKNNNDNHEVRFNIHCE